MIKNEKAKQIKTSMRLNTNLVRCRNMRGHVVLSLPQRAVSNCTLSNGLVSFDTKMVIIL